MSIELCTYCETHIDTDFDPEHFDTTTDAICIIEEQDKEEILKHLWRQEQQ